MDGLLHIQNVQLPADEPVDQGQAAQRPQFLQHHLLLIVAHIDVLRHKIRHIARVRARQDIPQHVAQIQTGILGVLLQQPVALANEGLGPDRRPGIGFRLHRLHLGGKEGLRAGDAVQISPGDALHHHLGALLVGDAQHLIDPADGAHLEKAVRAGDRLGGDVSLGDEKQCLVGFHSRVQRSHGLLPIHVEYEPHTRKDTDAPQGDQRIDPSAGSDRSFSIHGKTSCPQKREAYQ